MYICEEEEAEETEMKRKKNIHIQHNCMPIPYETQNLQQHNQKKKKQTAKIYNISAAITTTKRFKPDSLKREAAAAAAATTAPKKDMQEKLHAFTDIYVSIYRLVHTYIHKGQPMHNTNTYVHSKHHTRTHITPHIQSHTLGHIAHAVAHTVCVLLSLAQWLTAVLFVRETKCQRQQQQQQEKP